MNKTQTSDDNLLGSLMSMLEKEFPSTKQSPPKKMTEHERAEQARRNRDAIQGELA